MTIKSRVLLSLMLGSPVMAQAVGLGDIRLGSALNQPFVADIDLLSVSPDAMKQLHASLASREIFASHGLDRPQFLNSMSFKVVADASGHPVLQVRSPEAVTEPFVTLLIEVSWAEGRLVREYTVLLDPPVFDDKPAPASKFSGAVKAPVSAPRPAKAPVSMPAPSATAAAPIAAYARPVPNAPSEGGAGAGGVTATGAQYQVSSGDSLSVIAHREGGVSGPDVNRWMVATFRANPAAFDGNINRLHRAATLTLPTPTEWQKVNAREAIAEVHAQMQGWQSGSATPSDAHTVEQAQLKLVPAKDLAAAPATPAQSAAPQATAAPQAAPGASGAVATPGSAQASGNAAPGQDAEAARVARLQEEVAEARRQLELKSTELAAIQNGATPVNAAPSGASNPPTPSKPVVKPPAEPTFMEWLAGQALTLGAGLLVIIAAIVGVTSWRRRRAAAEFESIITPVTTTIEPWEPAPPAPAFGSIGLTATAAEATPSSLAATATPVEVSVADPLQEADFHIAYGLYGQAADLLKRGIDREPARRDYQLKLLEVYYLSSNADGFIALAERLRATAASGATAEEEWARITVMGAKLLPKHPLFASAGRPVSAPSVALDVDLGQLPETGRAVDDTQPRLQPLDEHTVTMKMATQPFVEHDLTLELSTSALTEAPAASADRSEVTGTVRMLLDDAEKLRLDDFVSQHSSSSRESDAAPERAAAPPVRAAKTSDTTLVEKLSLSDLGLADLEGVTLSEVGTKLDLARAYMEMGDPDGARQILNEVIREGSPAQQSDARRLLSTIPG